ncbi:hypothetical protein, partial [Sphingosinicella soli]|uniref:hypothetical protein n=1 Tax=Sphingosinicella soli TaxID=333708 RepID=UPI001A9C9124
MAGVVDIPARYLLRGAGTSRASNRKRKRPPDTTGRPLINQSAGNPARCLIPGFDGALFSQQWKDALWDRYSMGAPQR